MSTIQLTSKCFKQYLQTKFMTTQHSLLLRTDQISKCFKPYLENNSMKTKNSSLLRTVRQTHTTSFLRCRGDL